MPGETQDPDPLGKSVNGLGITSLMLGILAALMCWSPFLPEVAILLAVLGIIVGAIGLLIALIGRKSGVRLQASILIGLSVCIVSLILSVVIVFVPWPPLVR